ncbi:HslVU peptidase proteolytic subunit [Jeotgalibaca porci]|jgi:ATP-dependent HslUV protease subunit HslV|uniref:ATP-dependent protease subunit HslV n=2 Tax=Jeotgalibaca porci TaxID=1868793 RepID=A0A6G7WEU5_9LACT|nr:HslU--HslV peptidase proteolytic subunit [Jeotgalibaca porci]NLB98817.1 HslU--HslV peptidase proteolytic subunit [Lactobacillales bacterium]QIK50772.1 HslU--HslV peptidase proteolytic subunit [Jeotgalibaca porci]
MTTICAIQHNGKSAMAGDGQVTLGESVIMKGSAKKIRRIYNDQVIVGFAGGVADAFTLEDKFEEKLNQYKGNLLRASIEVAREWRGDRAMQKLEALLIVMDKDQMFLVSGSGEVIEPDDGILTIGSGGNFALAAARALKRNKTDLSARDMAYQSLKIASEICVYTNDAIMVEEFV